MGDYMIKGLRLLATQLKKNATTEQLFYANPKADIKPNIFYHGSPYNFDTFDVAKIGTGEGCSKRGQGIYLFRTPKFAPYFANIKSKDAPLHIGSGGPIENPVPTVYTVKSKENLNLKQVSLSESKTISRNQKDFETKFPEYDGIELPSTEICIFPKALAKLQIVQKQEVLDFVAERKNYPFRQWTTDNHKLEALG